MSNERETELLDILNKLNNDNNSYISLLPKEINNVLIEYVLIKRLYRLDDTKNDDYCSIDLFECESIDEIDFINNFCDFEPYNILMYYFYQFYKYLSIYPYAYQIEKIRWFRSGTYMCGHPNTSDVKCNDSCIDYEYEIDTVKCVKEYQQFYIKNKDLLLYLIKNNDIYVIKNDYNNIY